MSSRKQQALDRLLDVSGPGCFNEVTGTWMVGRRHHHHHHHAAPPPPPPPPPEPSPEPEAPEPEARTISSTTASPTTTTPSGGFYPDYSVFANRGMGMPAGTCFSSTLNMASYPYLKNPGGQRLNFKLASQGRISNRGGYVSPVIVKIL